MGVLFLFLKRKDDDLVIYKGQKIDKETVGVILGTVLLVIHAISATLAIRGINNRAAKNSMEKGVTFTYIGESNNNIVYRHEETGVYYLVCAGHDGCCVMVNADGTPYTGKGELLE